MPNILEAPGPVGRPSGIKLRLAFIQLRCAFDEMRILTISRQHTGTHNFWVELGPSSYCLLCAGGRTAVVPEHLGHNGPCGSDHT